MIIATKYLLSTPDLHESRHPYIDVKNNIYDGNFITIEKALKLSYLEGILKGLKKDKEQHEENYKKALTNRLKECGLKPAEINRAVNSI